MTLQEVVEKLARETSNRHGQEIWVRDADGVERKAVDLDVYDPLGGDPPLVVFGVSPKE